jgi:hypothetical protein
MKLTSGAPAKGNRAARSLCALLGRPEKRERMMAWRERSGESALYGRQAFPACRAHADAAEAVHSAVERLSKTRHPALALDDTVADVLGYAGSGRYPGVDSLATAEKLLAIEEEYAASPREAMDEATAQEVLAVLLGPAVESTSWDAQTVWLRSIHTIINARAGRDAPCSCVKEGAAQQ